MEDNSQFFPALNFGRLADLEREMWIVLELRVKREDNLRSGRWQSNRGAPALREQPRKRMLAHKQKCEKIR